MSWRDLDAYLLRVKPPVLIAQDYAKWAKISVEQASRDQQAHRLAQRNVKAINRPKCVISGRSYGERAQFTYALPGDRQARAVSRSVGRHIANDAAKRLTRDILHEMVPAGQRGNPQLASSMAQAEQNIAHLIQGFVGMVQGIVNTI